MYQVFSDKCTGQLSAATTFLNTAGCFARIFTTLQEVDDNLILTSYVLAGIANVGLTVMFLVYPKEAATKKTN
eukprot:m.198559 g.198559  ORF g.198559 m.198559 type:complete len:73 (-) comp18752_c1_seq4:10-228(-)